MRLFIGGLSGLGILTMLLVTTSSMSSEYDQHTIKVVGSDNAAVRVCRSIVKNDSKALDKLLLHHQSNSAVHTSYFRKGAMPITRDFSCNNSSLLSFADEVGAENIVNYLIAKQHGSPVVTMDDMSVASN